MMAKMFYTLEEVCQRLGKNEAQIKEMVSAGQLREFRDGSKLMFKVDKVDELAGSGTSSSGAFELQPASESGPGSGTGLDHLEQPADTGGSAGTGLDHISLEDTGHGQQVGEKEDTVITSQGISVFDADELPSADEPTAKTQIAPAVGDQISLDASSGSGSGLLDLTREADDTSLGAELLDEIYPGDETVASDVSGSAIGLSGGLDATTAETETNMGGAGLQDVSGAAPITVQQVIEQPDRSAGLFAGLMLGAILSMLLAGMAVGAMFRGVTPNLLTTLAAHPLYVLLGVLVVVIVCALIGFIVGRSEADRKTLAALRS